MSFIDALLPFLFLRVLRISHVLLCYSESPDLREFPRAAVLCLIEIPILWPRRTFLSALADYAGILARGF